MRLPPIKRRVISVFPIFPFGRAPARSFSRESLTCIEAPEIALIFSQLYFLTVPYTKPPRIGTAARYFIISRRVESAGTLFSSPAGAPAVSAGEEALALRLASIRSRPKNIPLGNPVMTSNAIISTRILFTKR